MNYQTEMVKMMKQRENKEVEFEPCIGRVIKAPPEIEISIYDGQVILLPHKLYMNDRLYNDYTREFDIEGDITEITIESTSSSVEASPGPHKHKHGTIEGTGKYKAVGTIINTDTLIVGDYVKVVPTEKGQKWFIDSKYRKVKP
ncbi:DUF2577 family protein [Cetobacterium sp. 2A]|uniref:DUF2577 family protein n=1 Tax=Cetobacterium sp. 2A TaxID=2754723 RepID=UPI00163C6577|nr:DUF2577 family protein [Cetobacterium sp. 2A]MBC2855244.1 DUF2577 family protein [Cetobacterium sp. 2A]MBC2855292.1 DUF2577 family protein [Cetobacterium sp. 2A]MBC2855622.1 DUF2577 family protein [Cetobacterium sp. 2A]